MDPRPLAALRAYGWALIDLGLELVEGADRLDGGELLNHPYPSKDPTMILIYKVATTGLPDFKAKSDASPTHPHMVHVAARLYHEELQVDELDQIVRPDGWEIPSDSVKYHGIAPSLARQQGLSEDGVLARLLEMDAKAEQRIAHNEAFDSKVVRIAMARYPTIANGFAWEKSKGACSMKSAVDFLSAKYPDTFYGRQAKLERLWEDLLGEPFPYSKSAMDWVQAVADIHFAIQRQQKGAAA